MYLYMARRNATVACVTVADSMWASGASIVHIVLCDPVNSLDAVSVAAKISFIRRIISMLTG